VVVGVGFALVGAERRERAAELVDLAEKFVKQGLNVAAYLVEHELAGSLR
jgi:hypothetical protein